ncbi:MAG: class I SAM-dependent methyltransferase [candidate division NC10 bacterium]
MIAKLVIRLCQFSPYLKRLIWRKWYDLLAGHYQQRDWSFMNYGYVPLNPDAEQLRLDEADEPNRYCIQLYHHVASGVNLKDADVLEISSGRGGGSYYINRYLEPKTMVGVDYSEKAVAFCNQSYCIDGLSFVTGDAELLPFKDNRFDVIVNVEASHCYGSKDAFLTQVKRVLRKDGYFLYADLHRKGNIDTLYEQLRRSGLTLIKETNITPNVLEALDLDNNRKTVLIQQLVPKVLLNTFQQFAGLKGTTIYEGLRSGSVIYLSFVLQKQQP